MKRLTVITLVFCGLFAALFVSQINGAGATGSESSSLQRDSSAPAVLSDKIRALGSQNPTERASAACQIGEMGDRASIAIPHLIRLLGDDAPINTAFDCGERRRWRGKQSVEESTTPGQIAAEALAAIGVQSVEPLIAAVTTDNPIVRANAVWSLGIIQDPRTVAPVVASLRDAHPRVRENAAWGLGLKQDKSVVEPLIAALADGEWRVREKAGWSLGLQGDARSVEPLVTALRDENAKVREQVAWSLGLKGDRNSVEALTYALRDGEWRVREKAAWSLGLKGDNRAVDPLIIALKDESDQVKAQAAWALGLKGDHRAVEALAAALKDQNNDVRRKASWALGLILMRDGKAAEKAAGLDLDFKRR